MFTPGKFYENFYGKTPAEMLAHKQKFKPCLDQLMEISSTNQIKPSVFDQHESFSSNIKKLGAEEADSILSKIGETPKLHAIQNSQAHMDSVCTRINSIASREVGTFPKIPGIEDIQIPPMVPSKIPENVVDLFAGEVKEAILGLSFNTRMVEDSIAAFKAGSTKIYDEDLLGRSYMYCGKLRANPHY